MLWQRLPYENGWSFYGTLPIYYFLGLVYLRGRDREGWRKGKMKKKIKIKRREVESERGGKKRQLAYSKLWVSLTYISVYFTTSSRKALSPPKGNTGRADTARESKPLTCWRLNK